MGLENKCDSRRPHLTLPFVNKKCDDKKYLSPFVSHNFFSNEPSTFSFCCLNQKMWSVQYVTTEKGHVIFVNKHDYTK